MFYVPGGGMPPHQAILTSRNSMPRRLLILFVLGVLGIGWTIGATNLPGPWYASLQKPWFNPPNWVFAPTWTVLYIMIAIAGWRAFLRDPKGNAFRVWVGQIALNFAWSPTVFTFHNLALGLVIILSMLVLILTFIVLQWRSEKSSALLFVPYAAWDAFASVLNFALFQLN